MKRPDLQNYELWLTAWLDGTLDESRREQFILFLSEHPDLEAEAGFLSLTRLTPDNVSFPGRHLLKKTEADLPASQIGYLSVAYLENQLSATQKAELAESIRHNSRNLEIFDSVQKLKLVPPAVTFRRKGSLKRLSSGILVFRFAAITLSIAATIAVLVLSYIFVPDFISAADEDSLSETIQEEPVVPIIINLDTPIIGAVADVMPQHVTGESKKSEPVPFPAAQERSPQLPVKVPAPQPLKAPGLPVPQIEYPSPVISLSGIADPGLAVVDIDDRGLVRKFFARTFRDKILREGKLSDEPVKAYEIARAGVDGINKLLDWDMQLKETLDESGELKSVYFRSALITFNAPHKKSSE